jgi:hypothetical protein
MRSMVKLLRTILILSLSASVYAQSPADDIASRAVDILGAASWPQARYFAFTFHVEREGQVVSSFPQRWDRVTGDYRVSGKDPQGRDFEVVMNVVSKKGRATINGEAVTDPAKLNDILTNIAGKRFVNDVFWLLMPLRMTEPDVKREFIGERSDSCGRVWNVLKLTFPQGALYPGDAHWAWISKDTGIVEEWDMKLTSLPEDRPTEVLFHDYRRIGGLYISTRREVKERAQIIRFDDLQILPAPPKGAFQ